MSIYLIRHGKTAANERRLYCGSTDLPLSVAGAAELRQLRYAIAPERFVTSGMKRTEETLKLLFGDVPFAVDVRFREMDFGDFEMRGYEELKDDPAYQAWISGDNEANVPPHGESGAQMTRRALEAFREIPDGTAVIAHGGVIAAIMASLFPGEGKHRYQWQSANGHGYEIDAQGYRPIP
ncbi:MAG: histidine phosphatase family protein [Candidatus Faecousia sp.]|nr:histidine phosphatase family protein [Candidatus Faecousia sp.]